MTQILMRLVIGIAGALSLWNVFDGVSCLVNGHFVGKRIPMAALGHTFGGVMLPDGTAMDYGFWAGPVLDLGLIPERLAPYFVGLGVLGLVALVLFLLRRPSGWTGLLVFSAVASLHLGAATVAGGALFLTLLAPAIRQRIFGIDAQEIAQLQIRLEPLGEPSASEAKGIQVESDDES